MHRDFLAARNVLFDLDGTLVDSGPLHDRAFRDVLAEAMPEALAGFDYAAVRGQTTAAVFRRLGVDDAARCAELTRAKQARYRALVAAGALPVMAGAADLLRLLGAQGRRCYLVTSASRASADAALAAAGLGDAFAGTVAAEDAPYGKPAPDLYLRCLTRFGVAADDAVAVEDSPAGFAAARAAGVAVVAVHGAAGDAAVDVCLSDLAALAAGFAAAPPAGMPR
ncbi:MAG: HAD family hydrolase [Alphaproteobacteria bacterium]